MDRLAAMTLFVTAADAGSLSAAGRKLGVPLTTVSRNVAELEGHLGAQLFTRSSQRLALTDVGRSYLGACKRVLDDVHEAERAAAGEHAAPRGELIITAPTAFGRRHVVPLIAELLAAHPGIDVQLLLTDRRVALVEERVDVAVRVGELMDSSLRAIRLGACRQVVCASPAYWAARGTPRTPADLAAHDCVTLRGFMSSTLWAFRDTRVPVHSRLVVDTADAAVAAAIAGAGVTSTLSYQVADGVRDGTLAIALKRFEPPPRPVSLVFAPNRFQTQRLRAFCDFAAPRLRAVLRAGAR